MKSELQIRENSPETQRDDRLEGGREGTANGDAATMPAASFINSLLQKGASRSDS